mmetsp:Transcript_30831/g.49513  ORF Transcript_30831/g.49513 Transcript_30831/m.49513 type:complete len:89 (+) Transcript_30831:640-906(+)
MTEHSATCADCHVVSILLVRLFVCWVFFLLHAELSTEDKVRIALGVYALHRAVMHNRFVEQVLDGRSMLFLLARRGADHSKAKQLLCW